MRKRTANSKAVENIIAYLEQVKYFSGENNKLKTHTLSSIARDFSVSNTIGAVLKETKIVSVVNTHEWIWLTTKPDKDMALIVMDNLLHRRKKTSDISFPEMAELISAVKHNTSNLIESTGQTKVLLQGLKTPNKALHKSAESFGDELNLFSKQEQRQRDRISIAGGIAASMYQGVELRLIEAGAYTMINSYAITAADNLLEQLNK